MHWSSLISWNLYKETNALLVFSNCFALENILLLGKMMTKEYLTNYSKLSQKKKKNKIKKQTYSEESCSWTGNFQQRNPFQIPLAPPLPIKLSKNNNNNNNNNHSREF